MELTFYLFIYFLVIPFIFVLCSVWIFGVVQNEGNNKRLKTLRSNENCENKAEEEGNSGEEAEQPTKLAEPPKQDYIHVRARRGQATDSHSLAERVISLLQLFTVYFQAVIF